MMRILRTAADSADGRRFVLVYGNRDFESIAFHDELDQLTQRVHSTSSTSCRDPPPAGDTRAVSRARS